MDKVRLVSVEWKSYFIFISTSLLSFWCSMCYDAKTDYYDFTL